MKSIQLKRIGIAVVEAALVILSARWFGAVIAVILSLVIWWVQTRRKQGDGQMLALALVSLALLQAINHHWLGQLVIASGYVWWRWAQLAEKRTTRYNIFEAGWLQFATLAAIFSAQAVWHWPLILVLVTSYGVSLMIARNFFGTAERSMPALAAAWGLIVAESAYIFSIWLVNYVLLGGVVLIPQAAVVITALGYCFGSIYLAHTSAKLSKARLAEYAIIGLCLIVIVIAGTKWSGAF